MENWKIVAWIGVAILTVGLIFGITQGATTAAQKTAEINYNIAHRYIQFGTEADRQGYLFTELTGTFLSAFLLFGGPFVAIGAILIIGGYYVKGQEPKARVCPNCNRNLRTLPTDIQKCPYCGRTLSYVKSILN